MERTLPIPSIRLLKQLSRNIYSSFKVGLKEIINNSFDANATKVDIEILADDRKISISDNGVGMSAEDVYSFFLKAGSTIKERPNSGKRPTIGYKGIGVFSLFFFADSLRITSRYKTEPTVQCLINLRLLREKQILDDSVNTIEILEWSQNVTLPAPGTIIEILEIEEDAFKTIWKEGVNTTEQMIFHYLSEVLPICYNVEDRGLSYSNILRDENSQLIDWNFHVCVNSQELVRQTPYSYFEENDLLDSFYIKEFSKPITDLVSVSGVLFGTTEKIKNPRLSGFLLRNNNIAIGSRKDNPFDMRSRVHMLQWISGEILISGNINEIITTDRERLVEDNDIYVMIRDAVQEEINPFLSELLEHNVKKKKKKDRLKEAQESIVFEKTLGEYSGRVNRRTVFKLENFPIDDPNKLVKYDEVTNEVKINTASITSERFSKWTDKELFYSFLGILQNKFSKEGNDCCKELLLSVQTEFDQFISQSEELRNGQSEFGF